MQYKFHSFKLSKCCFLYFLNNFKWLNCLSVHMSLRNIKFVTWQSKIWKKKKNQCGSVISTSISLDCRSTHVQQQNWKFNFEYSRILLCYYHFPLCYSSLSNMKFLSFSYHLPLPILSKVLENKKKKLILKNSHMILIQS